jgi:hypothetical protein
MLTASLCALTCLEPQSELKSLPLSRASLPSLLRCEVAKFASVAYGNILERRSKLCHTVPRWNFLDLLSFNISYGSACHGGRYEPDTSVVE